MLSIQTQLVSSSSKCVLADPDRWQTAELRFLKPTVSFVSAIDPRKDTAGVVGRSLQLIDTMCEFVCVSLPAVKAVCKHSAGQVFGRCRLLKKEEEEENGQKESRKM